MSAFNAWIVFSEIATASLDVALYTHEQYIYNRSTLPPLLTSAPKQLVAVP